MKISKSQLKQIIKEELDATLAEQGGGDMAAAAELAQTLSQSPVVMAAVEKAVQNPEVQQKAAEVAQELQEEVKTDTAAQVMSVGTAVGGTGTALMVMQGLGMIGSSAGGLAALGLTTGGTGLLVAAMGILLYNSFQDLDKPHKQI